MLKDPRFLASLRYLKTPERIMALLRVMTVCGRVYAALEYRRRQAWKDHDATFPNPTGPPVQNPPARWGFQVLVGLPVLLTTGEGPWVLNLAEAHQCWLQRLGKPSRGLDGIKIS